MNKSSKIALIVTGIILIIIVCAGFYFLRIFSEAFGSKCEKTEKYIVQEYQIQEFKCIGWAGPPWYPTDVYKNGKLIAKNVIKSDSCNVKIKKNDNFYLYLNICNNSIEEVKSNKHLLSSKDIDSIQIYSNKLNQTKRLKLSSKIITDWNKSQVWDLSDSDFEDIFYPNYDYKILIFQKNSVKEFLTKNNLIADTSKWIYQISNDNNKEYFENIWNEE